MKITYKNFKIISYPCAIISIVLLVVLYFIKDIEPILTFAVAFLAIVFMVVSVGFLWHYDNCPYCGTSLARIPGTPSHCPNCGKKLT